MGSYASAEANCRSLTCGSRPLVCETQYIFDLGARVWNRADVRIHNSWDDEPAPAFDRLRRTSPEERGLQRLFHFTEKASVADIVLTSKPF